MSIIFSPSRLLPGVTKKLDAIGLADQQLLRRWKRFPIIFFFSYFSVRLFLFSRFQVSKTCDESENKALQ